MTAAAPTSSVPSAAWHGVHRSESTPPASSRCSLAPERRGRLKNGNRPGDFLAAPRCGARTRCDGECRQPAMPNGRCRMHGGLSTGPRTAEGRARSRRARWKHGARSAEVRVLCRAARVQLRRVRTILSRTHFSAGHGVHRTNSTATPGMPNHRGHRDRRGAPSSVRPARIAPSSVSSVLSVSSVVKSFPSAAGHGVHRAIPQPQPGAARPRSPAAKSPSPAWHGVHRSFRDRLRASASLSALVPVLRSPALTTR